MPKVYNRQCDNCKKEYKGFGKQFCSSNCVTRKPHSEQTKIKLSRTWFKKGHFVSEETRQKLISLSKNRTPWNKGLKGWRAGEKHDWMPTGEAHWNWKNGKSRDRHCLSEKNYKEWRMKVFARDDFKCKIQNSDCKGQLQAHHILRWAEYPELRYDLNNGITLCVAHHPRKKSEEKRLAPQFFELVSVSNE